MEYEGKLYGKIGDQYFDTGKTSKDWDEMEQRIEDLEAEIRSLTQLSEQP